VSPRRGWVSRASHLVGWVRGDIDRQKRGGRRSRGVRGVAGYRRRLGTQSSQLAGEAVDLSWAISISTTFVGYDARRTIASCSFSHSRYSSAAVSGLGCLIGTLWPSLLIAIVVPGLRCGWLEVCGVAEAGVIVGGGGGGGMCCDVRLDAPRDGACGLCGKKLISGAIEVLCVRATSPGVLVPVRPKGNDAHAAVW